MHNSYYLNIFVYICTLIFIFLLINLIVMEHKKFLDLIIALSKLGLSTPHDPIKVHVPRKLLFEVLHVALDGGFKLLIDSFDPDNNIYSVTIKY